MSDIKTYTPPFFLAIASINPENFLLCSENKIVMKN